MCVISRRAGAAARARASGVPPRAPNRAWAARRAACARVARPATTDVAPRDRESGKREWYTEHTSCLLIIAVKLKDPKFAMQPRRVSLP